MNRVASTGRAPAFLTIVTVCYNADKTISQTIESVLAQTSADYEYLIIDGGSADATLEIIESYRPRFQSPITVISEPDDGIYDAMNKALSYARGRYVWFVNADDWCEASAVESFVKLATGGDCPRVLCGAVQVHKSNGAVESVIPELRMGEQGVPLKMLCHHQGLAVDIELLNSLNGFNKQYSLAADYDLFIRLMSAGVSWAATGSVVAHYSEGGSSDSPLKTANQYRQVRLAQGMTPLRAWALWVKNILGAGVHKFLRTM